MNLRCHRPFPLITPRVAVVYHYTMLLLEFSESLVQAPTHGDVLRGTLNSNYNFIQLTVMHPLWLTVSPSPKIQLQSPPHLQAEDVERGSSQSALQNL